MSLKADELRLPAAVVGRIIKDALPANAIVAKDARVAIARAAAVFIVQLTDHANDYASSKNRKLLTAEDVYQAVKKSECEQIEKPLKEAVEVWKALKQQRAEENKKKKAERIQAAKDAESATETPDETLPETLPPPAVVNSSPVKDIEDA